MAWDIESMKNLLAELAIAFLVIGIVYAQVAKPMLDSGIQDAITAAQAANYTSTENALNKFGSWIQTGLTLLILGTALIPLANSFSSGRRKKVPGGLALRVTGFSVLTMIIGILLFGLGLPAVIEAQVISDTMLAGIISLSGIGIIFIGIGALTFAVGRARSGRRKRTATAPIVVP